LAQRRFLVTTILLICCLALIGCVTGIGADQQGNPVSQINELGQLTVSFIDVGQGDSILIQTSLGQSMLIDGGERNQGEKLVEYLQKQGIDQIDVMVGTHPHSDHIGGLIAVLENFQVEKIYLPKVTHSSSTFKDLLTAIKNQGLKINTAQAGAAIPIEGVDASFIAPAIVIQSRRNEQCLASSPGENQIGWRLWFGRVLGLSFKQLYSCTIGYKFGCPTHDLGTAKAHGNYGICSQTVGLFNHSADSFLPGFFQ
jgi:beta-lactamase superfamily II metal-dependent hydrolase